MGFYIMTVRQYTLHSPFEGVSESNPKFYFVRMRDSTIKCRCSQPLNIFRSRDFRLAFGLMATNRRGGLKLLGRKARTLPWCRRAAGFDSCDSNFPPPVDIWSVCSVWIELDVVVFLSDVVSVLSLLLSFLWVVAINKHIRNKSNRSWKNGISQITWNIILIHWIDKKVALFYRQFWLTYSQKIQQLNYVFL